MVAEVNDKSAKSVNAVVPEEVGVTLVKAPPPAEYELEGYFVSSRIRSSCSRKGRTIVIHC